MPSETAMFLDCHVAILSALVHTWKLMCIVYLYCITILHTDKKLLRDRSNAWAFN
jgi:hypothetical protein